VGKTFWTGVYMKK